MAAANVVNLDALIPREDFAIEPGRSTGSPLDKISVLNLEGPFFGPDLRKPDFQRETQHWSPAKVVDLLRAFIDKDLIPAVILWRSGNFIFVVDGAHRLSALLAWIFDDYGDRKKSLEHFDGRISEDQRKIAQRTRDLVNKEIGSYAEYRAARDAPGGIPDNLKARLSNLADVVLIAQWVPTTDAVVAENSFFKINQAATPLDPTEVRILKSRKSASAIASRAITHAGTGHKYWSDFADSIKSQIEKLAEKIYKALYEPPITGAAINTLDVPIAGKGYSALPFVFDFVNQVNNVSVADSTTKRAVKESLPEDKTGETTLSYLQGVMDAVEKVTTDSPVSLGLHPVVYFYSRTGVFLPVAFFGAIKFFDGLRTANKLVEFSRIRAQFEDFLVLHKEAISMIVHTFGAGARSIPWIASYYQKIFYQLILGLTIEKVQESFGGDKDFLFLLTPRPAARRKSPDKKKNTFSTATKSSAYFDQALPGATRCGLCNARVHRNSMHIDHKIRQRDGGHAGASNAQVVHPYCDSTVKG